VPQQAKDDIAFSYQQVHGFALKQRESLRGFETELYPGLFWGSGWCMQVRRMLCSGRPVCHAARQS